MSIMLRHYLILAFFSKQVVTYVKGISDISNIQLAQQNSDCETSSTAAFQEENQKQFLAKATAPQMEPCRMLRQ